MRPPWEDETDFVLPAANWARSGVFAIPQWEGFFGSEHVWRWHMPLFPVLLGGWLKLFGIGFITIRLFTLIPAALALVLGTEICTRLTGARPAFARPFWLLILLFDKGFIGNALAGRMEFHAALFCLIAVLLAFETSKLWRLTAAGLSLGVAASFHPFAGFFLPAILVLALRSEFTLRTALSVAVGFAIPVRAHTPLVPFGLACAPRINSSASSAAVHRSFCPTSMPCVAASLTRFAFNPRFCLRPESRSLLSAARKAHPAGVSAPARIPATLYSSPAVGYLAFLLRGSAGHLYYYLPLAFLFYFFCATFLPPLRFRGWPIGYALLAAVLLNNSAFAAAKTWTVWQNRALPRSAAYGTVSRARNQRRTACRSATEPLPLRLPARARLPTRLHADGRVAARGLERLSRRTAALVARSHHPRRRHAPAETAVVDARGIARGRLCAEVGNFERVFLRRYEYSGYRLRLFRKTP